MNRHPSSYNGWVRIKKYRITVEEIEEPKEVYIDRVKKLWRECDNHHHWQPLQSAAKRLGIELDMEEMGKDRKRMAEKD